MKNADGRLTLELEDGRSETVDCLISAIGREPANDNIDLEAAGVKTNEKGYIVVDKYQNTDVEGIYAVGDNTGAVELTPVAVQRVAVSLNACLITSRMASGLQQHSDRGLQPSADWYCWFNGTAGARAVWRRSGESV
ncbi:FAD-dependent oxidoreductase [Shigella flexneri]